MKKRIVTITGGTGGYVLLQGLRKYSIDITGVFSPFDSGGSSGRLRKQFGGISWGDLRRGLEALMASGATYSVLKELLEFRFPGSGSQRADLSDQNLGNLILLSLAMRYAREENRKVPQVITEDSQRKALLRAEILFGLESGRHISPSTFEPSDITVVLENGKKILGGRQISQEVDGSRVSRVILTPSVVAPEEVLDSIRQANAIIIGPGALYDSILPNLLVGGIGDAIRESGALLIFICNTVAEENLTDWMKGSDFIREVSKYLKTAPKYAIFNNPSKWNAEGKTKPGTFHMRVPIEVDEKQIVEIGTRPIIEDLRDDVFVDRHDAKKLARTVVELIGFK